MCCVSYLFLLKNTLLYLISKVKYWRDSAPKAGWQLTRGSKLESDHSHWTNRSEISVVFLEPRISWVNTGKVPLERPSRRAPAFGPTSLVQKLISCNKPNQTNSQILVFISVIFWHSFGCAHEISQTKIGSFYRKASFPQVLVYFHPVILNPFVVDW